MNRRIKTNISQYLHRIGYIVKRGSSNISIKRQPHQTVTLQRVVEDRLGKIDFGVSVDNRQSAKQLYDEESGWKLYEDRDNYISGNMLQGILSAEGYMKQGIQIQILNKTKIYSIYGVWAPTRQSYLKLFKNALQSLKVLQVIDSQSKAADLGCGTGVLSIAMAQLVGITKIWAFDSQQNAVEATELNAQVTGCLSSIKVVKNDLIEIFHGKGKKQVQEAKIAEFCRENLQVCTDIIINLYRLPQKFNLIVCNPPWIGAQSIKTESPVQNGVFDHKHKFLTACFSFACNLFSHTILISQIERYLQKGGRLLVIFSDLSQKLGLSDQFMIENMCSKKGLVIKSKDRSLPFQLNLKKSFDALKNYKQDSNVILYQIAHQ